MCISPKTRESIQAHHHTHTHTIVEPEEEPLMSHAIVLEAPAVSGWKTPVPGELPTQVENPVSILDMSGVRINYLPSACEPIQSLTDRSSTAQGAPLHEDRTDSTLTVSPRIIPASRAEPTFPEVPTAPVFRQQPPKPQRPHCWKDLSPPELTVEQHARPTCQSYWIM